MTKDQSRQHGKSPYAQESSTRHHRAAELEYGSGDHKKAAHEAQLTHGNAAHASHHAEMTADAKIEHHGMQDGDEPGDAADAAPAPAKKKREARRAAKREPGAQVKVLASQRNAPKVQLPRSQRRAAAKLAMKQAAALHA